MENKENLKRATIVTKRKELLHDIGQECYTEGDMLGNDLLHAKHLTQDVLQPGMVERVMRTLCLAHDECVELLGAYAKTEIEADTTIDDRLTEPEEWRIELEGLPATMSGTSVRMLGKLVHEYMVCRVMQDRLTVTKSSGAADWLERLVAVKAQMKGVLCRRTKPVRRKLSPW